MLCSVTALRAINLGFLLMLPVLYSRLLRDIRMQSARNERERETASRSQYGLEAVTIALFPVASFFGFLYYTDLGGLVCILLALHASFSGSWALSALAGATSLLFRQTNIIWLAYIAVVAVIRRLERTPLYNPSLSQARLVSIPHAFFSLAQHSLIRLRQLTPLILAFVPVFSLAGAFLAWNGSIVLGDKSNHIATIHAVQPLYFSAFAVAMMAPSFALCFSVKQALCSFVRSPMRLLGSLTALGAVIYVVKKFTIAHPFLLADNRHYAFYVWRRLLNVHPHARFALSIPYLVAIKLIYDILAASATMKLLELCLFVLATCATLTPSPLIEPRYFIVPFVLLRLHLRWPLVHIDRAAKDGDFDRNSARHDFTIMVEAAWYLAIQIATTAIFLWRPFHWANPRTADETGLMRFMW
ncbi:glucosyltransferase [Microbotryomycetes sp. JL201]|nr:glucosyltransferase [Microbotryomycetes sp. JL201]